MIIYSKNPVIKRSKVSIFNKHLFLVKLPVKNDGNNLIEGIIEPFVKRFRMKCPVMLILAFIHQADKQTMFRLDVGVLKDFYRQIKVHVHKF